MVNFPLSAFVALFILLNVYSVSAHNKVVVIPLGGDDAPAPTVYAIDDTGPAGGIVFHVTNDGLNGLEAAPVDQGTALWGCNNTDIEGVVNIVNKEDLDPHSGAVNTSLIAVQCTSGDANAATLAAAYVWPNGQTDGFLPNKEELGLLYIQQDVVGGFVSDGYWSSSESDSAFAWGQGFDSGGRGISDKNTSIFVRAIRTF